MADGRHPFGVRRTALATVNDYLPPGAKQGVWYRYGRWRSKLPHSQTVPIAASHRRASVMFHRFGHILANPAEPDADRVQVVE